MFIFLYLLGSMILLEAILAICFFTVFATIYYMKYILIVIGSIIALAILVTLIKFVVYLVKDKYYELKNWPKEMEYLKRCMYDDYAVRKYDR